MAVKSGMKHHFGEVLLFGLYFTDSERSSPRKDQEHPS